MDATAVELFMRTTITQSHSMGATQRQRGCSKRVSTDFTTTCLTALAPGMLNMCETTRVPGRNVFNCGRSWALTCGSGGRMSAPSYDAPSGLLPWIVREKPHHSILGQQ